MERSSLSGLRSYLATAASCAAIALSVGYVAESANSFAYKDPIKHSRALFYTAVWVAKDAAYFSLRRKLRTQEKQRIADNTSQLSLYITGLHENPVYPSSYISLAESLSDPKRFSFKEGSEEGVCEYFDPTTGEIALLRVNNNENITTESSVLLHELTHALGSESFPDPRELDYISYMRKNLQEECVAVSSENYGLAKILANPELALGCISFPQITNEQVCTLIWFITLLPPLSTLSEDFSNQDKEMLFEAALYSMVSQNVYQTPNTWWTHYTKGYNDVHGTNHQPPDNGFEVPLLPPTLARQVSGVFNRIFERIPEDQHHGHPVWQHWMRMTGIDLDTLKLAAAQKTWPTYPSEVLTGMNSGQNILG